MADRPQPAAAPLEAAGIFADPSKNTFESLTKAATATDWTVPIEVINCGTPGCDGDRTPGVYTPLPAGSAKGKNICALLPHVKDPYWLGIDEALVSEARRSGASLQVYEAGGYTEIGKQIDQLSNCVAGGADAVLVGAVSNEALNNKIDEITAQGIPVIDMINGVTTTSVSGRALFDYCTLGGNLGKHLKEVGEPVKAVWFPGPAGVGSLEQLMSCFKEQTAGSNVELLGVQYGDTGKDAQLDLVENALEAYPEMNYVLGSATTVDAATGPLTERRLQDQVKTASYYFTPEVASLLKSGGATCSSAGNDLVLAKVSLDMAARTLAGEPLVGGAHIGTPANVICGPAAGKKWNNLDQLIRELNLPSEGFQPVFSVN
ncbi:TMAO reductase system periplasmic protein TorT [Arthrobacter sp. I2-34]|uniref:TMAO reductase system periplasmic protein TorT n=1 Tax=Arthrobacter hankyongi TaxID=2904801 RepID=A0ABS9LDN7_9MICC|nr:TMAO reductase system periplasmic protein TorT [Arthrobacter hankyongi]MCG2624797.1 TMAO reductase system periplasmic protein TorT [Arthrobacter hankyongi]